MFGVECGFWEFGFVLEWVFCSLIIDIPDLV